MSDRIRDVLQKLVVKAKAENRPLDHILFYGSYHVSAKSLALAAQDIGVSTRIVVGSTIEKQGDFAAILTHLGEGDILFIDGIHRLDRSVGSILQPVMRDSVLEIVVGKGATAKTVRLNLPKFTVIGITPKPEALASDLLNCFSLRYSLTSIDD